MNIHPRCYPCQLKRVLSELRLCDLSLEEELDIAKKMVKFYGECNEKRSSWLGCAARDELAELTGKKDPYAKIKMEANRFALKLIPKFKTYLNSLQDEYIKFEKACLGAVIGNQMEFFLIEHEFNLKFPKPFVEMLKEQEFSRNDLKKVFHLLKGAENILILPDNAGEIAFDKVLIEVIKELFPHIKITVAVKPEPIINDATLEDAKMVEIDQMDDDVDLIDTGVNSIGLFLQKTSETFRSVWNNSDLIMKKGMGHAETRDELGEAPPCPVLYLLRIKCTTVGELLDAELKQNIALLDEFHHNP